MCKYCDAFKLIPFDEKYQEMIDMDEFYNPTIEESIYLETYLYKPKLTNAIYLTSTFNLFHIELPQKLRIKYCPFCGEKIEQDYLKQPSLFNKGVDINE